MDQKVTTHSSRAVVDLLQAHLMPTLTIWQLYIIITTC